MSSRALRKAQREKEEQERLDQLKDEAKRLEEDGDEEDIESKDSVVPVKQSAFAMLGDVDEDADDQDEPEETVESNAPTQISQEAAPRGKSSSKKKKKKKKKPSDENEDTIGGTAGMDEIDKALKLLSTKAGPSNAATTKAAEGGTEIDEIVGLYAVDTSHLHAANEMRRLFGRTALQQEEDEAPPQAMAGGNRRQQRRVQQAGLAQALRGQRQDGRSGGLAAMALRRNIFIQGKEEWAVATGGGLGMEIEEKCPDGSILYRFVHNTSYQDVQSQFETAVASMDPNRLIVLLQHNPYHISTLLQVSEIAKQERDHTTSGDLLERALFSFGRAIHSSFAKSLQEGKARLDFRRAENREFWLASWRYMQNLTMRATWRTVYEWAKLLLQLSPQVDPYELWLVLDQYALRSRQDLDYLNICQTLRRNKDFRPMPNVQLSQGLAEYRAGNQSKGKQALFTAIGKFPFVVARLFQELNIDPPPAIWGKEPRTEREKLYSELYANRAKDLWNTPETSALLTEVASAIPPDTAEAEIIETDITQAEARHVILSDEPTLIALIPRKYTTQLNSSSDPLPPDDAFMSYLSRRQAHPMTRDQIDESVRELGALQRFFHSIRPWLEGDHRADLDGTEDGADDGAGLADRPLDEDEVMQHLDASGVSARDFTLRAQRLMELQGQLAGQVFQAGDQADQIVETLVSGSSEHIDDDPSGLREVNGGDGSDSARAEHVHHEDDDQLERH